MTTDDTVNSGSTPGAQPALHAVLVPGFWLGSWAWRDVEPILQQAGVQTHPVTLPGQDGGETDGITLDVQIDAVARLVASLDGDIVLIGHSGGGAVVQGVIDRVPELVRRVVYVDSGPLTDGVSVMPDAVDDIPLPSWDELAEQNASTEGMDDDALATFRAEAVAQPAGVARSVIRVTNPRRLDVPVSVICTSFPKDVLLGMIESGVIPSELGAVGDVRYIDLPTGHWPMFSRPRELAEILSDEIIR